MISRGVAITTACLFSIGSATTALAQEPTREELVEQLRQLQARVEQLEAKQRSSPTTSQATAADVDRVVREMVADAERRSRLMMQDAGITAGFDQQRAKFFLRSDDGNFLLMPGFLFQARNTTNVTTGDDDDVENGFEIRRMRFYFTGNVFTPELTYRFQWESNSNGGGVFLQDAFVRYAFARDWAVQVGQFYDEFSHEQSMLDPFMLAADRSLINALIGGGQTERVQGAMLIYDDRDHWRAQLLFHDGYNTDNTDWTDDAGGGSAFIGVTPTNFGASARVDYFLRGTRNAYDDFTALGNTEDLLVVGAGADYTQGGDSEALFHTVDVQYETTGGLALFGALHGLARDIGAGSAVPTGSHYDWGFLLQGAYLFTRSVEGFVRYDYTQVDDDALAAGADDQVHEITVGGNYYFRKHNVKFTLDLTWLPNGVPINVTPLGFLASDDDQFIIRAQLQLFI